MIMNLLRVMKARPRFQTIGKYV